MDKKRKKGYYIKCAKGKKAKTSHTLEAGMRGFFVTCNKMELHAVREAYSLLNEYADKLYGPEQANVTSDSDCDDIEAAMEKEVKALKEQAKTDRRFQAVTTGVANCIFIRTTLENPTPLCDMILEELHTTKTSKSRRIMKLFPIIGSCKTDTDKISSFVMDMIDLHLKGVTEFTFSIDIKIRHHDSSKKHEIMQIVTQAISALKPLAKVNLGDPEYAISVNILKRVFCFSILKNFIKFRKYNLQEIASTQSVKEKCIEKEVTTDKIEGDKTESQAIGSNNVESKIDRKDQGLEQEAKLERDIDKATV